MPSKNSLLKLNSIASYTYLSKAIPSEKGFISRNLNIINKELDYYYQHFVRSDGCEKARELKISRADIQKHFEEINKKLASKHAVGLDIQKKNYLELLLIRIQLQDDLNRLQKKTTVEKKSLKYFLMFIRKNYILAMIATMITLLIEPSTLLFIFPVVSIPIMLGTFALYAIENVFETWQNTFLNQRKTRYLTNLINVAIFGVSIAILAGAISIPFIIIPCMLFGTIAISYYQNTYIYKQLDADITKQNQKLTTLQQQLNLTIGVFYPHISENLKIQSLKYQIYACRIQIKKLEFEQHHARENQKSLEGMLFGAILIITAILTSPIPLLSLTLGIVGAFAIARSAINFQSTLSQRDSDHYNAHLANQRNMAEENRLVDEACKNLAITRRQDRLESKPPTNNPARLVRHLSTIVEESESLPVIQTPIPDSVIPLNNHYASIFRVEDQVTDTKHVNQKPAPIFNV